MLVATPQSLHFEAPLALQSGASIRQYDPPEVNADMGGQDFGIEDSGSWDSGGGDLGGSWD